MLKVSPRLNQRGDIVGSIVGIMVLIIFVSAFLALFFRGVPTIRFIFQPFLNKIPILHLNSKP